MNELVRTLTHVEYERYEKALAAQLADKITAPPPIDEPTAKEAAPFVNWCSNAKVRHLPAKPLTVAAFIFFQDGLGAKPDRIWEQTQAIERLHDAWGFANPVASWPARFALDTILDVEAPRSWKKPAQMVFAYLPPEIRAVIAKRERDRETAMRRAQNEAAELRNRLRAEADQSAETEKENDNNGQEKTRGLV